MTTETKTTIATFRLAERLMDKFGTLMLLVLGLATAGATVAVGL